MRGAGSIGSLGKSRINLMNPNRLVRLKSRPRGMATRENFIIDTEPVPPLQDGEIEIDTKFISLDPAMRGWMSEAKSVCRASRPG